MAATTMLNFGYLAFIFDSMYVFCIKVALSLLNLAFIRHIVKK